MQRLTITIWTISNSAVFPSVLQGTITWAAKRSYGWSQSAITCSKLPTETLEQGVKYLWTYFTPCSSVCIVNFEQVNTGWDEIYLCCKLKFWYELIWIWKNGHNVFVNWACKMVVLMEDIPISIGSRSAVFHCWISFYSLTMHEFIHFQFAKAVLYVVYCLVNIVQPVES